MKICLINNLYSPYTRGGAEQVVSKTVEGLIRNGHRVVLITTAPKGDWKEQSDRLTIYRFCPRNFYYYTNAHTHKFAVRLFWHVINIFHIGAALRVRKILLLEKPHVVHTHNLMGMSFLIPLIIQKLKIRYLHTVHDVQLVEPSGVILKSKENSWRYSGFPTKIYSSIMRLLFGSPDVVISPSQFLLDFYKQRDFFKKSKTVVLRNPITFESYALGAKSSLRNDFVFIYVGQLEKHKGASFLVNTFLNTAGLDANLYIVGNGAELNKIKKVAENDKRIKIFGRVGREQVASLFMEADAAIVPSLCYENSPTVIFESFYFGVPVLASNIEGIAELIREGENGLMFLAGNEDSLRQKLAWCVENKEKLNEMGKKTNESLRSLSDSEYIRRLIELCINQ
jgi:glycosyltransferase involved in cell wall biosynthesis